MKKYTQKTLYSKDYHCPVGRGHYYAPKNVHGYGTKWVAIFERESWRLVSVKLLEPNVTLTDAVLKKIERQRYDLPWGI